MSIRISMYENAEKYAQKREKHIYVIYEETKRGNSEEACLMV